MRELPPIGEASLAKLEREIAQCQPDDQDDMRQEAWVAFLEGRCPVRVVNTIRRREQRRSLVVRCFTDCGFTV